MNSNDKHFLLEWIREKNARNLKRKIRLERKRNDTKQQNVTTCDTNTKEKK